MVSCCEIYQSKNPSNAVLYYDSLLLQDSFPQAWPDRHGQPRPADQVSKIVRRNMEKAVGRRRTQSRLTRNSGFINSCICIRRIEYVLGISGAQLTTLEARVDELLLFNPPSSGVQVVEEDYISATVGTHFISPL